MIRKLLPDHIFVAEADPRELTNDPDCVARFLARRACSRAGAETFPSFQGRRHTRWPKGYVGAIVRTRHWCAAAVADASSVASIAIGSRADGVVPVEMWPSVFTDPERAWLMGRSSSERGHLARVVESAKHIAHRAQYGVSRCYAGMHGLSVELDVDRGRWLARILRPIGDSFEPGETIAGRFFVSDRAIVNALAIPARTRPVAAERAVPTAPATYAEPNHLPSASNDNHVDVPPAPVLWSAT